MTFEEFIKEVIAIIQESGIMHFLFSAILPFSAVIIAFKIAIRCVRELFTSESRYNNKKIKARDDVVCETRSDEDDADDDVYSEDEDDTYGESDQPHGFW